MKNDNPKSFRDYLVWQKSKDLALKVYLITKSFPREEIYGLSSQMRRSAVSVPSNIAEGFGRRSESEFLRYLRFSSGSLYELQTQTEIANELGYINNDTFESFISESDIIGKMISSLIKKILNDSR
ncbi:four helix bundle protein [Sedimentisphaera salicampi]|uniref:four helix bundle protein n=1 Tax=Sedimentisphaera salicampi TaxID=1941349 RepID=UPI000A26F2B8|nr:four helix bundle protein [Sedimentisphaera salicampi]